MLKNNFYHCIVNRHFSQEEKLGNSSLGTYRQAGIVTANIEVFSVLCKVLLIKVLSQVQ